MTDDATVVAGSELVVVATEVLVEGNEVDPASPRISGDESVEHDAATKMAAMPIRSKGLIREDSTI